MKYRIFSFVAILLAGLTMGACDSDDDSNNSLSYTLENTTMAPAWQMDWNFNQETPNWQKPQSQSFENWVVILVKIEQELQEYTSKDDLMALFVEDELRGLASPAISVDDPGSSCDYYLMKVFGNETDEEWMDVTLKYYNSQLKHVFSRSASFQYRTDQVIGIDEDFVPKFTLGPAKYPIVMNLSLDSTPLSNVDLETSSDDMVGAFVGGECRGVAHANGRMVVYGREEGEKVTLKYYEAVNHRVYTFNDAVRIKQLPTNTITIN
jgi:hypothetical protein